MNASWYGMGTPQVAQAFCAALLALLENEETTAAEAREVMEILRNTAQEIAEGNYEK